jgi:hypothetical protein
VTTHGDRREALYRCLRAEALTPADPELRLMDRARWQLEIAVRAPELRRLAIHEAAHAAVALLEGARVGGVRIGWRWPAEVGGYPSPRGAWCLSETASGCRVTSIAVNAAGAIGEYIAGLRSQRLPRDDSSDAECYRLNGPEYVESIARRTEATLRAYWPAVLRIAAALERAQWVSGEDVVRLFGAGAPAAPRQVGALESRALSLCAARPRASQLRREPFPCCGELLCA